MRPTRGAFEDDSIDDGVPFANHKGVGISVVAECARRGGEAAEDAALRHWAGVVERLRKEIREMI